MMIGFTYDDGGRKAAGYKGSARDCVVRAYAILTGVPYPESYDLFKVGIKAFEFEAIQAGKLRRQLKYPSRGVYTAVWQKAFKDSGIVKVKRGRGPWPTYTEAYEMAGNCIVTTNKHICAIIDGELRDTFDNRTYWWDSILGMRVDENTIGPHKDQFELRERKAGSIWVLDN